MRDTHFPSTALADFLAAAVAAARAGGEVIRTGALRRAALEIERKKPNDFVSEVDKASERSILDLLSRRFPTHAFQAEESGASGTSDYVWLIDPLDGTTNFLHGFPHYCVSIALQHKEAVIVGVVYDPVQERMFTAMRGGGAWLNGERLRVAARSGLSEAILGTGFPANDWTLLDPYLSAFRELTQRCAGMRRPGAAALDLAFVAAGWMDGFWETNLNAWDVGAGSLLVREAGGAVSDFSGGSNYLVGRQIAAGAVGVHRELVQVLVQTDGLIS